MKDTDHDEDGFRLVCLADVAPRPVAWLWRDRVPFGALTVLDGDPDCGKSTITLDLAARLTRGLPMPIDNDQPAEPAAVLLLSSPENDPATAVRPRLDAAGADSARVFLLDGDSAPVLPEHVGAIRRRIEAVRARLVLVDPVTAHVGAGIDLNDDADARRMLHPLADVARATGAAVILVRHNNKNTMASKLHRGGGSIAIVGLARSGLAVRRDKGDPALCVLSSSKSNMVKAPADVRYRIDAGRIAWVEGISAPATKPPKRCADDDDTVERVVAAVGELDRANSGAHFTRTAVVDAAGITMAAGFAAVAEAVRVGRLVGDGKRGAVRLPIDVEAAA